MKDDLRVKDLRDYLKANDLSQEAWAKKVQLSHMTIRRWLKKPDSSPIPKKYYSLIYSAMGFGNPPGVSGLKMRQMMADVEKAGQDFTDFAQLEHDLDQKFKTSRPDQIFIHYTKTLYRAAKSRKSSSQMKAVAAGALLYFLNPVDLIPDHVPVIGFMDDLAILSIAVNFLLSGQHDKTE